MTDDKKINDQLADMLAESGDMWEGHGLLRGVPGMLEAGYDENEIRSAIVKVSDPDRDPLEASVEVVQDHNEREYLESLDHLAQDVYDEGMEREVATLAELHHTSKEDIRDAIAVVERHDQAERDLEGFRISARQAARRFR